MWLLEEFLTIYVGHVVFLWEDTAPRSLPHTSPRVLTAALARILLVVPKNCIIHQQCPTTKVYHTVSMSCLLSVHKGIDKVSFFVLFKNSWQYRQHYEHPQTNSTSASNPDAGTRTRLTLHPENIKKQDGLQKTMAVRSWALGRIGQCPPESALQGTLPSVKQ